MIAIPIFATAVLSFTEMQELLRIETSDVADPAAHQTNGVSAWPIGRRESLDGLGQNLLGGEGLEFVGEGFDRRHRRWTARSMLLK